MDELLDNAADALDDQRLVSELSGIERQIRRLGNRQATLAAALTARRAHAARQAAPEDKRAGERAARLTRDELGERLKWSRSQSARNVRLGQNLESLPDARRAAESGTLSPAHLEILSRTLEPLTGQVRDQTEEALVAAGADQDPVEFGRTCRRLLANVDPQAAEDAQQHLHQQRRASVSATPDGMTNLYGRFAGIDGETIQAAIHAYRTVDPPGVHRRPEQITADAVVEICRVALRAGEAGTAHGVRPHVSITIDHETLLAGAGPVETTFTGPLPFGEVRRLLADAGVARILTDRAGVAVESGPEVRTVPAGVFRAIKVRDGGCIGEGCDMPPHACDVMHIGTPHRHLGTLTIETAALGCRLHHRNFDLHGWRIEHEDGRPVLRPPPRSPP